MIFLIRTGDYPVADPDLELGGGGGGLFLLALPVFLSSAIHFYSK